MNTREKQWVWGVLVMILTAAGAKSGMVVTLNGPVTAVVADHRYGAEATWSHDTDIAYKKLYYAEACGFKFNLALTVFDSPFNIYAPVSLQDRTGAFGTGRLECQIYFQTDRWRDPRLSDAAQTYPIIPDYYATTWSQAGVDAGFDVTLGASKPSRQPNHGQQLYDVSQGAYGEDVANGTPGSTNVFSGLMNHHINWVKDNFGNRPSAASYRNGQTGAAYAIPTLLLGARNSGASSTVDYQSASPTLLASIPSTTRMGDMDKTREEVLAFTGDLLRLAISTRGWYTDFVHWHSSPRFETTLHDFYESQRAVMQGHDVVTLNYGEALEHRVLRDMATVGSEVVGEELILTVTYHDPYGTLPLEAINIPLSVRVNTKGTVLEGKEIKSSDAAGIRKLSSNIFIVEVPFNGAEETLAVHLEEESGAPDYLDFTQPSLLAVSLAGGVLSVEADSAVRLAVFTTPTSADLLEIELLDRSNTLSTQHTLTVGSGADGKDVYIGAITSQKQSGLWKMTGTSGAVKQ